MLWPMYKMPCSSATRKKGAPGIYYVFPICICDLCVSHFGMHDSSCFFRQHHPALSHAPFLLTQSLLCRSLLRRSFVYSVLCRIELLPTPLDRTILCPSAHKTSFLYFVGGCFVGGCFVGGDTLLEDTFLEDTFLEDLLLEDALLEDALLEDTLLKDTLAVCFHSCARIPSNDL